MTREYIIERIDDANAYAIKDGRKRIATTISIEHAKLFSCAPNMLHILRNIVFAHNNLGQLELYKDSIREAENIITLLA